VTPSRRLRIERNRKQRPAVITYDGRLDGETADRIKSIWLASGGTRRVIVTDTRIEVSDGR
jgi:hypothetical protein